MDDDYFNNNPDSIFCNLSYLESLHQMKDDDDEYDKLFPELSEQDKLNIQNGITFGSSSGFISDLIKDYIEHPERSSVYRNEILFKQHGRIDSDNEPSKGWEIHIPLLNIQF